MLQDRFSPENSSISYVRAEYVCTFRAEPKVDFEQITAK